MEQEFLDYYNQELRHVRETAGEFGKAFPKIAGRLGMETLEVSDPYVERLLEAFAFMAARVQMKLDAKHPEFTQQLMDMVYPQYQSQIPSMVISRFSPTAQEGSLASGFRINRDTALWSDASVTTRRTACQFKTTQDLTLWPLEMLDARYFSSDSALSVAQWPCSEGVRAGIRLTLKVEDGLNIHQLPMNQLRFYLAGEGELPMKIYEQIFANGTGFMIRARDEKGNPKGEPVRFGADAIVPVGFDDEEAALPYPTRSFQGYRLLQEYFAFPEKFMFFELTGMAETLAGFDTTEVDILITLDRSISDLTSAIVTENFVLNCVPAINLFSKRSERVRLEAGQHRYHVSADRTRPLDYEIYRLEAVQGFSGSSEPDQTFLPFYGNHDHASNNIRASFYTAVRKPREMSSLQQKNGPRSSYLGSEMFLSIVDGRNAPYSTDLKQLGLDFLCTNRDLPLLMPVGYGHTDFTLESGAPVDSIHIVTGPSKPLPAKSPSETSWQFLNHLSLNYLSLNNQEHHHDAVAIREMLRLYADMQDARIEKQVEAVRKIKCNPVVRQMPVKGAVAYGRGIGVALECDEAGFEGRGIFLFGAVMERFFAKYASINSFCEFTLKSTKRGEVNIWAARCGNQQIL
ncbi:Uncharacterised protein [BD1-7 clade bacterium]|uniref:Type VI secretion system protein ImpG n=1 Tax=BD1-7 clade bacterium TaxID=2029982 RepID=A0A5S9QCZ3_9GAMM|nr:Uncharacterised protein [BD1-7 clade bacterium]CAA0116204.1 Uncharacterised protein [BD1-7 clade bacterium]CAA0119875.1 Uncharacterised protein [BD1-7 clade bacterium]